MPLFPEDAIRVRVKAELRKRLRGVRKTAPLEACRERSAKIRAHLETIAAVRSGSRVALFWPIEARHEVDLTDLDSTLRARGVRIAYPAIDPESPSRMTFRFVDDVSLLDERGYGFREPPSSAEEAASLDAIVVPALAIDPSGHRIGYGAGYYDRTLPRFAPPAVTIGVAYDYQLLAEVPRTEDDVAVRWIVTDTRVLEATGG